VLLRRTRVPPPVIITGGQIRLLTRTVAVRQIPPTTGDQIILLTFWGATPVCMVRICTVDSAAPSTGC
jgi:hypothetical protein